MAISFQADLDYVPDEDGASEEADVEDDENNLEEWNKTFCNDFYRSQIWCQKSCEDIGKTMKIKS